MKIKNFCLFAGMWASSICLIAATMQATGLGQPNCEPTTFGYVEFYATLFGCSVLSCILGLGFLGLVCLVCPRNSPT
jgi:hypothetical protein